MSALPTTRAKVVAALAEFTPIQLFNHPRAIRLRRAWYRTDDTLRLKMSCEVTATLETNQIGSYRATVTGHGMAVTKVFTRLSARRDAITHLGRYGVLVD